MSSKCEQTLCAMWHCCPFNHDYEKCRTNLGNEGEEEID